ncbi:MAG: hypothetical protein AB7E67_06505 [Xanthobacteraceae bacterium]
MSIGSSKLSVEQYDKAEIEGGATLSIPHLMAFRPVAFQSVGWPIRVSIEAELLRYVDHNCEPEVAGLFKPNAMFAPIGYQNSFTIDEKEIIAAIRERVANLTEHAWGRRIKPVTNLLVQLGPFRMMQQLADTMPDKKIAVFEVGPGAGYLGAMLAHAGHRYLSYDVAQSLYLWQNRLLAAVTDTGFIETAGMSDNDAFQAITNGRVVHFPWWHFVGLLDNARTNVDVVYSNSNLSEMTNVALRHVLHISKQMLSKSKIGMFCFFSKGMPSQTPHDAIEGELEKFGFKKVFDKPFHAFALNPDQQVNIKMTFRNGLTPFNPSGDKTRVEANEVVAVSRAEAPLDAKITQWLYGWQPPYID